MKMNKKVKLLLGILLVVSILCVASKVLAVNSALTDTMNELSSNSTTTNNTSTNISITNNTTNDVDTIVTPSRTNTTNTTNNTVSNTTNNTANTSTYNKNLAYAGPSEVAFGLLVAVSAFTVIGIVAFKKIGDYKNI